MNAVSCIFGSASQSEMSVQRRHLFDVGTCFASPTATAVLLVSLLLIAPAMNAAVAQTASFPYPKWFFSAADSASSTLMFRMFGFEGIARNLLVLTCTKTKSQAPVIIELIPPKSLEQTLRTKAPARPKQTLIRFISPQNTILFESR